MNKIINKNYNSIPHLSISKLNQQADRKINDRQEKILTKKARDWRDTIIVTEKLDGSNVGILKKDNKVYAITRSGFLAKDSNYKQHKMFNKFVGKYYELFYCLLENNWRICGEWMYQTHGTIYNNISIGNLFIAFDIFNENNERLNYIDFIKKTSEHDIQTTPLIHIGHPISIKNSLKILGNGIFDPTCEKPEGVVYRVERNGKCDFLAKYVYFDKIDGKYLNEEILNYKGVI